MREKIVLDLCTSKSISIATDVHHLALSLPDLPTCKKTLHIGAQ
jgi:hypothetical protein